MILPSGNTVLEADVINLLPRGVSGHFARVGTLTGDQGIAYLEDMDSEVEHEARKLSQIMPGAIGYGCTSGSYRKRGLDAEISKRLSDAAGGVPCTSATTATLAALRTLDVGTVAFCSPYETEFHDLGVEYFGAAGFDIVSDANLGLADSREIASAPPSTIAELARRADVQRAEAVFISCTGFPALEVLPALTTELGKPVLSSNAALVWHLLVLGKAGADQDSYASWSQNVGVG